MQRGRKPCVSGCPRPPGSPHVCWCLPCGHRPAHPPAVHRVLTPGPLAVSCSPTRTLLVVVGTHALPSSPTPGCKERSCLPRASLHALWPRAACWGLAAPQGCRWGADPTPHSQAPSCDTLPRAQHRTQGLAHSGSLQLQYLSPRILSHSRVAWGDGTLASFLPFTTRAAPACPSQLLRLGSERFSWPADAQCPGSPSLL